MRSHERVFEVSSEEYAIKVIPKHYSGYAEGKSKKVFVLVFNRCNIFLDVQARFRVGHIKKEERAQQIALYHESKLCKKVLDSFLENSSSQNQ